jgi:hypothetical protein
MLEIKIEDTLLVPFSFFHKAIHTTDASDQIGGKVGTDILNKLLNASPLQSLGALIWKIKYSSHMYIIIF